MAWRVGDRVLVRYRGEALHHERLLGEELGQGDLWVIATPDYDVYEERLRAGADIERVDLLPGDRSLPDDVEEGAAYLMYDGRTGDGDIPMDKRRELLERCRTYAAEWRAARRVEPGASGGVSDGAGRSGRRLTGKQPAPDSSGALVATGRPGYEEVWVVADPSRGLLLGAETEAPAVRLGRFGPSSRCGRARGPTGP